MTEVSSQPADHKPENATTGVDKSTEAFNENLQKRRDELVERLEKLKSEKVSPGSSDLSERANAIMQSIIQKQLDEIDGLKVEAEKKFQEESKQGHQSLDLLADEILKDLTDKGTVKIASFESTMNRLVKDKFVVTSEVYEISKVLEGIEAVQKASPELQQAFQKLQENKELTDDDFKAIIASLNPFDIDQQRHDSSKNFEATNAGVCLRFMRPDQRYKLVEMFMDPTINPQKNKDSVQFLEALLSSGHLTRTQGEELFAKAIKTGLLTEDDYEKTYKPKLETGGEYEKANRELQKAVEEELQKGYYGEYADNIMNRVVGKPALGALTTAWGFILVLLNVLANKKDLKNLAKNPYFYAGLAGMGYGAEMMTSTMKKGASEYAWGTVGGGIVSHAINSMDNQSDAEKEQKQARAKLEKLYPAMNPTAKEYIEQPLGGFETIAKVREEKETQELIGEERIITLDDLIKAETSTDAKEKIMAMKELKPSEQEACVIQINEVAEIGPRLNVTSDRDFKKILDDIDATQRPIA